MVICNSKQTHCFISGNITDSDEPVWPIEPARFSRICQPASSPQSAAADTSAGLNGPALNSYLFFNQFHLLNLHQIL